MKIYEINRAPLASPAFTGVPTAPTATQLNNSTQVSTTAYVDLAVSNAIAAVNPAVAVKAATTAASDTSGLTYNNGVAGIGAFFTGSVNTALTFDGVTLTAILQRVLIKNDTQSPSGAFNGVYYLSQLQTAILPPILIRALDYDAPSDINNTGAIPVVSGTTNANTSWLLTSSVTTVGTDALTYVQFSVAPTSISTILATASLTITNAGTTTVNASSKTFANFYASSTATSTTIAYSNIPDGGTVTIDYLKTTATDLVITFPGGTVVSNSCNAVVSGVTATLNSTVSGRYTITIININGVYKVYVVQDVL